MRQHCECSVLIKSILLHNLVGASAHNYRSSFLFNLNY